jgi:hypothetical protein
MMDKPYTAKTNFLAGQIGLLTGENIILSSSLSFRLIRPLITHRAKMRDAARKHPKKQGVSEGVSLFYKYFLFC